MLLDANTCHKNQVQCYVIESDSIPVPLFYRFDRNCSFTRCFFRGQGNRYNPDSISLIPQCKCTSKYFNFFIQGHDSTICLYSRMVICFYFSPREPPSANLRSCTLINPSPEICTFYLIYYPITFTMYSWFLFCKSLLRARRCIANRRRHFTWGVPASNSWQKMRL